MSNTEKPTEENTNPDPKPEPVKTPVKPKPPKKKKAPKTVTYDPRTFTTGRTLEEQHAQPTVLPYATPRTVPAKDVVIVEVVREQGHRKPGLYAIPVANLGRAIPEIGRVISVKLVK